MANKVVIFPVGAQTAATAYAAWTDAQYKLITGNPAALWAYVRNDVFGQWVVPYLGPPFVWAGVEVPEPLGGPAQRVAGVLHDTAVWPGDDI